MPLLLVIPPTNIWPWTPHTGSGRSSKLSPFLWPRFFFLEAFHFNNQILLCAWTARQVCDHGAGKAPFKNALVPPMLRLANSRDRAVGELAVGIFRFYNEDFPLKWDFRTAFGWCWDMVGFLNSISQNFFSPDSCVWSFFHFRRIRGPQHVATCWAERFPLGWTLDVHPSQ